jgi:hypothetical protein
MLRPDSGNAVGCLYYQLTVTTTGGFESLYLKMRFPMDVTDIAARAVESRDLSTEPNKRVTVTEARKDESGKCKIVHLGGDVTSEISTTTVGGKAVLVQAPKVESGGQLTVVVIGNYELSNPPVPALAREGHYTSNFLGVPVERQITFDALN